jgi:DNA-binding transcriptional MerR regulator
MDYTIQEMTKKTGLTAYTLRYYEKEGLIIRIKRNKSGHRTYNDEDVEWIKLIKCLKVTGMPVTVIKKFIKLFLSGDKTIHERKSILLNHRQKILKKIEEYNYYLEKINFKIEHYTNGEKI